MVTYMNGKRGGTMFNGNRTSKPVSLEEATKEFNKIFKAKSKDGYTQGEDGKAYSNTPDAGRISGHRPMLPNDLPKEGAGLALQELMRNHLWGLQTKADGENRGLIIGVDGVVGFNKNGLTTSIPAHWVTEFVKLGPCVLYGEQIGDKYFAFDIVEKDGVDLKAKALSERYKHLEQLFPNEATDLHILTLYTGSVAKAKQLKTIDQAKGEGVVFKKLSAPFEPGKNPNSIRYKLYEQMTCVVTHLNQQRSVGIGAFDPLTKEMVDLGNVTIPINQIIPPEGTLIDVRFLYRNDGGSLILPSYQGRRSDVNRETVTTDQITRIKRTTHPFDLEDSSLSEQTLQELAKSEFEGNMNELKPFMSPSQSELIYSLCSHKGGQHFFDKIQSLVRTVRQMPGAGEGNNHSPVIQLRYFYAGAEWLITGKDTDSKASSQCRVFGVSEVSDQHELGFINLHELFSVGAEIDLSFEPVPLEQHMRVIAQRAAQTNSAQDLESDAETYEPQPQPG